MTGHWGKDLTDLRNLEFFSEQASRVSVAHVVSLNALKNSEKK